MINCFRESESDITPEKRATIYQMVIPLRLVLTDVQFYGARRRRPFECAPLVVAATIFSKQSKVNDLFEIAPCGFVRQLKIPRDAGNGRRPAFNECQDHGSVNNNQLKVFSEAAVRKAAGVRPGVAARLACSNRQPIAHSRDLRNGVFPSLRAVTIARTECPLWSKADISICLRDVRFTSNRRHPCPKRKGPAQWPVPPNRPH